MYTCDAVFGFEYLYTKSYTVAASAATWKRCQSNPIRISTAKKVCRPLGMSKKLPAVSFTSYFQLLSGCDEIKNKQKRQKTPPWPALHCRSANGKKPSSLVKAFVYRELKVLPRRSDDGVFPVTADCHRKSWGISLLISYILQNI